MVQIGLKKRLANPEQVVIGLLLERAAGHDTRMDEGIVALALPQSETGQECLGPGRGSREDAIAKVGHVRFTAFAHHSDPIQPE